jgi:hypothetical protein
LARSSWDRTIGGAGGKAMGDVRVSNLIKHHTA